jgi:hypothetical protein
MLTLVFSSMRSITENGLFSVINWAEAFPWTWRWLLKLLAARTLPFSPGLRGRGGMDSAATDSL